MKLAVAILFVKDVPRARVFYESVLGLAFVSSTDDGDFVQLDAGGPKLALHAIPRAIAKKIVIDDPPRAREGNPIKLAFHADDPEAERERLVARGVAMGKVRKFEGVVFCDGTDPEGNVFQITNR